MAKQYFDGRIDIKALAIVPVNRQDRQGTPGLGYFWSGVAGKAKWELEILGVNIIDTFRLKCVMLGWFLAPNRYMLSSEMVDKVREPTRHVVGSEVVTDMEHVKTTVGDVSVKRPYHKAADAKAIADGNLDEVEKAFNLIDRYLHVLGFHPQEVFEYTKREVANAFFSKRNFVDSLAKMG